MVVCVCPTPYVMTTSGVVMTVSSLLWGMDGNLAASGWLEGTQMSCCYANVSLIL